MLPWTELKPIVWFAVGFIILYSVLERISPLTNNKIDDRIFEIMKLIWKHLKELVEWILGIYRKNK